MKPFSNRCVRMKRRRVAAPERAYTYVKDNYIFKAPSRRKNKKYDVFSKATEKYIASFGDNRYAQYRDKIGHYRQKDHNDKKRRAAYYNRHGHMSVHLSPKYFSHKYLW